MPIPLYQAKLPKVGGFRCCGTFQPSPELGTTSVAPLEVDAAGRLATALLSAVAPPRHMSLR